MGVKEAEVPDHIKKGLERSQAIQEEYIRMKGGNPDDTAPEPEEDDLPVEPGDDEPDEGGDTVPEGEGSEEDDEGTASPAGDDAPPPGDPDADEGKDIEYWKQRFKVLQRKYDVEVPRYAQEVRELKEAIQLYRQRVASLEAQADNAGPDEGSASRAASADASARYIDPARFDEYGEDVVELAEKLNATLDALEGMKRENGQMREQFASMQQAAYEARYEQFLSAVRAAYPRFDEQDKDPEFWQWIDEYKVPLAEIGKNMDVERVVKYYKMYADLTGRFKASSGKHASSAQPRQTVSPPRSAPDPQSLVAPGKRMWKRSDIATFYKKVQSGGYSEEEADRLREDLFSAYREGRIVG